MEKLIRINEMGIIFSKLLRDLMARFTSLVVVTLFTDLDPRDTN